MASIQVDKNRLVIVGTEQASRTTKITVNKETLPICLPSQAIFKYLPSTKSRTDRLISRQNIDTSLPVSLS